MDYAVYPIEKLRFHRHIACDRDFFFFQNHMYETLFEPLNSFRKDRNHVNKIFSSYLCLIRMTMSYSHDSEFSERLNGAKSVLFI